MTQDSSQDPPVTVRRLSFDDPGLPAVWDRLYAHSDSQRLSQTFPWHRVWHATYPTPTLLLLAAERAGEIVAIAPLYATEGMVFFLGVGEADLHDFLGAAHEPGVMEALLAAAIEHTPGFLGFKLHLVPEASRTGPALARAATRLGLNVFEMGDLVSVFVDIGADPAAVRGSVSRSMRKAENYFHRNGDLVVRHLTTAEEVLPLLPEFYEMHAARWRLKEIDSQFLSPLPRLFIERWVAASAERGWLRVVRLEWNGKTLGTDLNWHFGTTQFSGQWVFAIEHFNRSPGQILLRHSVLLALDAGMQTYDLGLGDQAYKFRLPSQPMTCRTWGLYPP